MGDDQVERWRLVAAGRVDARRADRPVHIRLFAVVRPFIHMVLASGPPQSHLRRCWQGRRALWFRRVSRKPSSSFGDTWTLASDGYFVLSTVLL